MKTLILLVALTALSACDMPVPKKSLRSGMMEMEGDFRELRAIIGNPAQAERAKLLVGRMRAWADKPVFLNRPSSVLFKGSAENFNANHTFYRDTVEALKAAIETSDPNAMRIYAKVKMSCEVCHKEFRPGL